MDIQFNFLSGLFQQPLRITGKLIVSDRKELSRLLQERLFDLMQRVLHAWELGTKL